MDFRLLGKEERKMNVEKSLEKAGVDTKKYPSLAMQNILGYQGKAFAENSYLYRKIMEDGHVFNPYIHRRWLPYQFMNAVHWTRQYYAETIGYVKMLEKELMLGNNVDNWKYMYDKFGKELNALYTLSKRDKKAYKERWAAFGRLEILKYFSQGFDCIGINQNTFLEMKNLLADERFEAERYWRYTNCLLCKRSQFRKDLVTTTFHSGIYFTLKHIMMFDYEKLHMSSSQKESLKRIREDLINGDFNYEQAFTIIEDYVARYYNPR